MESVVTCPCHPSAVEAEAERWPRIPDCAGIHSFRPAWAIGHSGFREPQTKQNEKQLKGCAVVGCLPSLCVILDLGLSTKNQNQMMQKAANPR